VSVHRAEADVSLEILSCVVIGREIKKIVVSNCALHERISRFLKNHVRDFGQSTFLLQMAFECKRDLTEMQLYVNSILAGIS